MKFYLPTSYSIHCDRSCRCPWSNVNGKGDRWHELQTHSLVAAGYIQLHDMVLRKIRDKFAVRADGTPLSSSFLLLLYATFVKLQSRVNDLSHSQDSLFFQCLSHQLKTDGGVFECIGMVCQGSLRCVNSPCSVTEIIGAHKS